MSVFPVADASAGHFLWLSLAVMSGIIILSVAGARAYIYYTSKSAEETPLQTPITDPEGAKIAADYQEQYRRGTIYQVAVLIGLILTCSAVLLSILIVHI